MRLLKNKLALMVSALLWGGNFALPQQALAEATVVNQQSCSLECMKSVLFSFDVDMRAARTLDITGFYGNANKSFEKIVHEAGPNGHPIAAARISYSYIKALGRPANIANAETYARIAFESGLNMLAEAGVAEALYYRGLLRQHGVGGHQELDLALADFKRSLAAGEPLASIAMVDHPALDKDIRQQFQILERSAADGFLPGVARYTALVLEIDANLRLAEDPDNEVVFFKTKQGIKSIVGDKRPPVVWKNEQFSSLMGDWDRRYETVLEQTRVTALDFYPSLALLHFFALAGEEIDITDEKYYEKLEEVQLDGFNVAEFVKLSVAAQIMLETGNETYGQKIFEYLLDQESISHPRALIVQGEFLTKLGQYDRALQNFETAASYGYVDALYYLGLLFKENWHGMRIRDDRGYKKLTKSEQMEVFYRNQSEGAMKAISNFEKAANAGDPRSALQLVFIYTSREYDIRDKEKARYWAEKLNELDYYKTYSSMALSVAR
ncbi:hypothetical protein PsAD46_00505 [Pseudovibrio sp. Ad46]|uniref:hypothetical protein n=1 Tax=unclassified Pseudovibrio TaxID=2627060 RepID=UPI0007AE445E|nr:MULTISPECIES: hypothetical protein [unclassified Pseudovibrio]KZK89079.1 hypothetical protein PsAD5_05439 [Pseudovibrio sp. Ad5]KZK95500.1 hypothetical protein PsAD46_00505 [Pseudovibrio sp. Ad46]